MNFKIGITRTKENAIVRKMFYNDEGLQVKPEQGEEVAFLKGGEPAPCITWYLTTLKGKSQKKIADEMVEMDTKKGSAKMKTGTATESRVIASVIFVDGLEWDSGKVIEKISLQVYADLEIWQINQLGDWIDEINQDSDEDKEGEKGES